MAVNIMDDGWPEVRGLINSAATVPAKAATRGGSRAQRNGRDEEPLRLSPKDVRFFQWLETPPRKNSNHWNFDAVRDFFGSRARAGGVAGRGI